MRRDRISSFSICLGLLLLTGGYTHAADRPDLSQIERSIARQPVYKAKQPLYGLYVFGPEAKTRVWAILDKSKPDAPDYDVLYFDRNADGDLTAPEERTAGKVDENGGVIFDIGSFTDPVTKQKHTKLLMIRWGSGNHQVTLWFKWCDKDNVKIYAGYTRDDSYAHPCQFALTPAKAPVLWPGADGSLSFHVSELKLNVGEAEEAAVLLGHPGYGRSTFCAVSDTFLSKEVPIFATLLYTDKEGKERRVQSELRERC